MKVNKNKAKQILEWVGLTVVAIIILVSSYIDKLKVDKLEKQNEMLLKINTELTTTMKKNNEMFMKSLKLVVFEIRGYNKIYKETH